MSKECLISFVQDLENRTQPPRRLTSNPTFENAAALSPDGRLYFISSLDGKAKIYWIKFDPSVVTDVSKFQKLISTEGSQLRFSISPDGEWIAFSSNAHTAISVNAPLPPSNYRASKIYKVDKYGQSLERLTQVEHNEWEGSPQWTQDGKSLYFYSTYDFCKDDFAEDVSIPRIYHLEFEKGVIRIISSQEHAALSPYVGKDDRLYFSMNVDSDKTEIAKRYGQWSIVSSDLDGKDLRCESDFSIELWNPVLNSKNKEGELWAIGGQQQYGETPPLFPKPVASTQFLINKSKITLSNEELDLYAVRGYFPNYLKQTSQLAWCDDVILNLQII